MDGFWIYLGLLALSVGCFAFGTARTLRMLHTRKDVALNHLLLNFSVFLVAAVWCVRYAVGLYMTLETAGGGGLNAVELVADSLLHTLQTFSMDEDYTTYILNGKQMLVALWRRGTEKMDTEASAWLRIKEETGEMACIFPSACAAVKEAGGWMKISFRGPFAALIFDRKP